MPEMANIEEQKLFLKKVSICIFLNVFFITGTKFLKTGYPEYGFKRSRIIRRSRLFEYYAPNDCKSVKYSLNCLLYLRNLISSSNKWCLSSQKTAFWHYYLLLLFINEKCGASAWGVGWTLDPGAGGTRDPEHREGDILVH